MTSATINNRRGMETLCAKYIALKKHSIALGELAQVIYWIYLITQDSRRIVGRVVIFHIDRAYGVSADFFAGLLCSFTA